jgi:deoxyribose-phosphate aldolase
MNEAVYNLAKMIDHSILHPTMTDEDLKRECEVARKYDVASVCVKPYAQRQRCIGWLCDWFSIRKLCHCSKGI